MVRFNLERERRELSGGQRIRREAHAEPRDVNPLAQFATKSRPLLAKQATLKTGTPAFELTAARSDGTRHQGLLRLVKAIRDGLRNYVNVACHPALEALKDNYHYSNWDRQQSVWKNIKHSVRVVWGCLATLLFACTVAPAAAILAVVLGLFHDGPVDFLPEHRRLLQPN